MHIAAYALACAVAPAVIDPFEAGKPALRMSTIQSRGIALCCVE